MNRAFVLALRASWVTDPAGEGEGTSLAAVLRALDGSMAFTERLNGVATAVCNDYETVEALIKRAYDQYGPGGRVSSEQALPCLDMLLLAGDDVVSAVQRLEKAIARRTKASQVTDYPVCVYIEEEIGRASCRERV